MLGAVPQRTGGGLKLLNPLREKVERLRVKLLEDTPNLGERERHIINYAAFGLTQRFKLEFLDLWPSDLHQEYYEACEALKREESEALKQLCQT